MLGAQLTSDGTIQTFAIDTGFQVNYLLYLKLYGSVLGGNDR